MGQSLILVLQRMDKVTSFRGHVRDSAESISSLSGQPIAVNTIWLYTLQRRVNPGALIRSAPVCSLFEIELKRGIKSL